MKCPACQAEMVELDFGGVAVDVCKDGCKGMWFDWFELEKLDETHEGFGQALKEALEFPRENANNRGPLNCPKCNIPMHAHQYQSSNQVNIDECYRCAGFFLDSGELGVIRDTFLSDEEKQAYAKSLLEGIPEYQVAQLDFEAEKQQFKERKKKVRECAIRKFTKFVDPSYYLNIYGERD